MAGLYEIWRNTAVADDEQPGAFLWSATVITTTAEDSLGHIHDRMPMLVERAGYDAWLDAAATDADALAKLLVPAAPGSARRPTRCRKEVNNVTQQRRRAGRAACRSRASLRDCSRRDDDGASHRDARRRRPAPHRPCATPARCAGARPRGRARARTRATSRLWPRALPRTRHLGVPDRAAVARRRQEGRRAARGARRGDGRLPERDPGPHAARPRRAQRRRPGRLSDSLGRWARSAASRWPSRCTRRAGPSRAGSPS